jgi:hypothetical protein
MALSHARANLTDDARLDNGPHSSYMLGLCTRLLYDTGMSPSPANNSAPLQPCYPADLLVAIC